ncbi:MAG: response regulator [Anaerolineae bacterium]|jgi:DNA-binding response OmpR family regulator|nr:response regulator [Anaerolineae bacterium]
MTTKKALIIEDNKEIGEIYRLTIGILGYDCEQITNGKVALERLDAEIPDIIILDMNLPEVSGYYLYKKIRASPNYENVPVIISTANMLVARNLEDELHPQDRLLVKPVHPRALGDLVETLAKNRENALKPVENPTEPVSADDVLANTSPSETPKPPSGDEATAK